LYILRGWMKFDSKPPSVATGEIRAKANDFRIL